MIKKISILSGVDEYRSSEPTSANMHDADLFLVSLSGTPGYPYSSEGWATGSISYGRLIDNVSNSLSSFQDTSLSALYDYLDSRIELLQTNYLQGYVSLELRYGQNDDAGDLYNTWFGIGMNNITNGTLYRSVSTNDEYVIQSIFVDNITTMPVTGDVVSGANGVGTVFQIVSAGAGPTYELHLKNYSGYFVDNETLTGSISADCQVASQNNRCYVAVYENHVYDVDAHINFNRDFQGKVAIQYYHQTSGIWINIDEANAYFGHGIIHTKFKAPQDTFIQFAMINSSNTANNLGRPTNITGEEEVHAKMLINHLGTDGVPVSGSGF